MNKSIIMGHLGKDPELSYASNGTPRCTFSVATKDVHKDAQGARKEQTEWHNVVTWAKAAENASRHLRVGSKVLVEGKMKTRSWDDNNGIKHYMTEIHAQSITFLDWKVDNENRSNHNENRYGRGNDGGNHARNGNRGVNPYQSQSNVNDEDMPF